MIWLAACSALLMAVALVALRLPPVHRAVLMALVGYWALAFVLRPIYVLETRVGQSPLSPFFDRRFVALGFERVLAEVAATVAVGLIVMLAAILLLSRSRVVSFARGWGSNWTATLLIVYGVGALARLVSGAVPLVGQAAFLATPAVCLLVAFAPWKSSPRTLALLGCILAVEALAATSAVGKGGFVAVLLALLVRVSVSGSARRLLVGAAVMAAAALAAFVVIQPMKMAWTSDSYRVTGVADGWGGDLIFAVLRRFDMSVSVADSVYAIRTDSYSIDGWISQLVSGLTPDGVLGFGSLSSLTWTREIRRQFNPDQFLGVPLADGVIAEGNLVAGLWGVVLETSLLAVLVLVLCSGLTSRRLWVRALCATPVFSAALFERGVLGLSEALGKGLQAAVVVVVVSLLMAQVDRGLRRRAQMRRRQSEAGRPSDAWPDLSSRT